MSGGFYNSTIKRLCPQSRSGRRGQMWAEVHPWDTGWERDNCSEPHPRADMAQPDGKRYLEVVYQQLTVENIHERPACREEARGSYTLPTPLKKETTLPPTPTWIAEDPQGPPRTLSVDSMCAHRFAF